MSLARGKYGVEYDARVKEDDSSGLGWVVILAILVATGSLAVTIVHRARSIPDAEPPPPVETAGRDAVPVVRAAVTEPGSSSLVSPDVLSRCPPKLRNLLMKLAEAEKAGDIVLQVNAIEQIRALPGPLPGTLDDDLAKRLGELNVRWLFEFANAQWVSETTVKSGDTAIRIAQGHGSTFAALKRLNPGLDVERLVVGDRVKVMDQPRCALLVTSGGRQAELRLNGKFFKRYPLRGPVTGAVGGRELDKPLRNFLAENGIWFFASDRSELETIVSRHLSLTVQPKPRP